MPLTSHESETDGGNADGINLQKTLDSNKESRSFVFPYQLIRDNLLAIFRFPAPEKAFFGKSPIFHANWILSPRRSGQWARSDAKGFFTPNH